MVKLSKLKGVGPKKEAALKESGIETLTDLAQYLPRKYQDRTQFKKVAEIEGGEDVHLVLTVLSLEMTGFARNQRLTVTAEDDTGIIELVYFHGAIFWKKRFRLFFSKIRFLGP